MFLNNLKSLSISKILLLKLLVLFCLSLINKLMMLTGVPYIFIIYIFRHDINLYKNTGHFPEDVLCPFLTYNFIIIAGCYQRIPLNICLCGVDQDAERVIARNLYLARLLIERGANLNYRVPVVSTVWTIENWN